MTSHAIIQWKFAANGGGLTLTAYRAEDWHNGEPVDGAERLDRARASGTSASTVAMFKRLQAAGFETIQHHEVTAGLGPVLTMADTLALHEKSPQPEELRQ